MPLADAPLGAGGILAGPLGPALAIAAMAIVTYLCRIGGAVLMSRVHITPPMERALGALPGSIVAATVVPIAIGAGLPAFLGIGAAVATTRLFGNEIAALLAGLGIAAGARALGF